MRRDHGRVGGWFRRLKKRARREGYVVAMESEGEFGEIVLDEVVLEQLQEKGAGTSGRRATQGQRSLREVCDVGVLSGNAWTCVIRR